MQRDELPPVARDALIRHLLHACGRYFAGRDSLLLELPVVALPFPAVSGPLRLVDVALPDWGAHLGCDGLLAVPHECCVDPAVPHWQQVDWWLACFLMLEGWHERVWERERGPVHSFAYRLSGWDPRAWEHAWVNRIALFLRAWVAQCSGGRESELFGAPPRADILLTHDVDAVAKTWAIRLKQTAFLGFNALRLLARRQWAEAGARLARAWRFFFSQEDWWKLDDMREMERKAGLRSQFHFYADARAKTLHRWLFDPGYDVTRPRLAAALAALVREGWRVGLHQSYDAWRSPELMRQQRARLESLLPAAVRSCRQHWLRFSWGQTWSAQAEAGFTQDTTLMFNDRPGFRAAAALEWAPWGVAQGAGTALKALPTVLMDSHFYDYQPMNAAARRAALKHWLSEIVAVGGQAAVLWHPHTISADYGWREGFQDLLDELEGVARC
jgi:hypothetical protein